MEDKNEKKYDSAQEIFFNNFGSKYFMERNGELEEYKEYNISAFQENEWTKHLQNTLADQILNEKDETKILTALWHLSRLEIQFEEKVNFIKNIIKQNIKLKDLILKNSLLFEEDIIKVLS